MLDLAILKAFADNKTNETHNLKIVSGRAEYIVEKGKNAGYQCSQYLPNFASHSHY